MNKSFRLDMERIRHAIDIVKVGNHLRGVMDRALSKVMTPQFVQVSRTQVGRRGSQFHGIGTQRAIGQ